MSFFDMIQSFDTAVLEFIQNTFKCSFLDPIMAFFSYIGEMGLFWIAVGIVFIIFKKTLCFCDFIFCSAERLFKHLIEFLDRNVLVLQSNLCL